MMKLFILILISLLNTNIFAQKNLELHCTPTKPAINDYEPAKFNPTNNLLRSSGNKSLYCGTKVIISGRILDKNCAPVPDAKVYLWQMGCDGKYPYKTLRTNIDQKMLNPINGSSFQGNGIATTNNMGQFFFITVYPPNLKNHKSNLNLRVEHRLLGNLQTVFYPSDENLIQNSYDVPQVLQDYTDIPIYNVEIVLPKTGLERY